jgi:hypothetical protein
MSPINARAFSFTVKFADHIAHLGKQFHLALFMDFVPPSTVPRSKSGGALLGEKLLQIAARQSCTLADDSSETAESPGEPFQRALHFAIFSCCNQRGASGTFGIVPEVELKAQLELEYPTLFRRSCNVGTGYLPNACVRMRSIFPSHSAFFAASVFPMARHMTGGRIPGCVSTRPNKFVSCF